MQFVKLGSLVRIRTGKLDANAANEHGAYPFFTCSKTALRIDKYAYDCECVLVAGNGDLNVKYFKGKFEAYQRTYIIESLDHKRLFVKYLYHFLNVYIEKLRHMSTGGVIKFIKINNLTDAVIPLPDLDTQISLSKEFDLLSSLIDGIDSQIKKSDELIKSRFIEMFETMDLSEERDEWVELEKLSKIYTGTTPSTNDASNWDGNVLWITPAEMTKDTFYVYDTTRKITEKGRKSKSLDMMPVDTVLLSTRAPIGKVGIVGTPMACNQGFKNFKCNERINPIFLYTLLKNNTEYLNSLGSGTTFLEISKTKIGKMKIPVPEIKLQNEFANYVQLIDKSKFIFLSLDSDMQAVFLFSILISKGNHILYNAINNGHFLLCFILKITKQDSGRISMNFDFVSNISGFENLYKDCSNAESLVFSSPDLSCISSRKANEFLVKLIYESNVGSSYGLTTIDLMKNSQFIAYFNGRQLLLDAMHSVRKIGNKATHESNTTEDDSLTALEFLHYVVGEILIDLGKIDYYPEFVAPSSDETSSKQVEVTPDVPVVPEEVVFEGKRKLRNIHRDFKDPKNIAELKKAFVKALLGDAGFNVCKEENISYPNSVALNMMLPDGSKVEYTLNGKNGKPLAVVEYDPDNLIAAKMKALDDVKKLEILNLGYKPIAYYTDGFNIHIIDQLGFDPRKVSGFHSQEELEYLIQKQTLMTDLSNPVINLSIAGREYQQKAIKAVCKAFNGKRRKSLIVLATGTGKTRLSVALVDLLSKAGWTKNVLFLADRKSLVRQANKAFKNFLPHTTTALYCGDSNEKDPTAKIVFSTYNSMMNLIDGEHNPFGIGHFDLIIIDEAHRSIFDKYGAIFDYFDSMMLGLTATPRGENNKSTYEVFELQKDHPDYFYELEEAVSDGYLVPFALLDKTTVGLRRGYKYGDLSDDEKEQLEKAEEERGEETGTHTDDDEISLSAKVVNTQTIDIMLHDLMKEGLMVENNEKIGKTIIFAKGHNEAEFIVDRFHKLYNYLPDDFCVLIDYASEEDSQALIDKFYIKDGYPQIAVSVDMLDTGIDVPEILNLVFFKQMQSKIKFLQMIGRGTRPCKDLYGPGKDKNGFYIFDYYDNFNYFSQDEKPWSTIGYEATGVKSRSISNAIYRKKVSIANNIQLLEANALSFEKNYKDEIIKNMVDIANHLNNEDISVKYNMDFVTKYRNPDNWRDLAKNEASIISHLLDLYPPIPGDPKVKMFDSLMYSFEVAHLEWELAGESEEALADHLGKYIEKLNKYVRKLQKKNKESSLPALAAKISTISDLKDGNLILNGHSVEHIEDIRKDLRDVMYYLPDEYDFVVIDVDDEGIDKSEEDPANKPYDEKADEWIKNNIKLKELVKLRMIEPLDSTEVAYLKQVFFSQLGTESEFMVWSNNKPILEWLRYQVGIDDGAIQTKFGSFLNDVVLTKEQLAYCNAVIEYAKQNGNITGKVLSKVSYFMDNYKYFDASAQKHLQYLIKVLSDAVKE